MNETIVNAPESKDLSHLKALFICPSTHWYTSISKRCRFKQLMPLQFVSHTNLGPIPYYERFYKIKKPFPDSLFVFKCNYDEDTAKYM